MWYSYHDQISPQTPHPRWNILAINAKWLCLPNGKRTISLGSIYIFQIGDTKIQSMRICPPPSYPGFLYELFSVPTSISYQQRFQHFTERFSCLTSHTLASLQNIRSFQFFFPEKHFQFFFPAGSFCGSVVEEEGRSSSDEKETKIDDWKWSISGNSK